MIVGMDNLHACKVAWILLTKMSQKLALISFNISKCISRMFAMWLLGRC